MLLYHHVCACRDTQAQIKPKNNDKEPPILVRKWCLFAITGAPLLQILILVSESKPIFFVLDSYNQY